jgi:hypothetical protein
MERPNLMVCASYHDWAKVRIHLTSLRGASFSIPTLGDVVAVKCPERVNLATREKAPRLWMLDGA